MLTRRQLIAGAAGAVLVGGRAEASDRYTLGPPVAPGPGKTVAVRLTAAERATALPCFGGATLPLWTFAEGAWPPLIRLDLGDRLEATLENRLPRAQEHTSIHWHGIRLPNEIEQCGKRLRAVEVVKQSRLRARHRLVGRLGQLRCTAQ